MPFKKKFLNNSKILIFIVYSLILVLYVIGFQHKLYISTDNRIKFHAIPIAISTLYQHHKHDYTGWRSTEIPFQNDEILNDTFLDKQIYAPVNNVEGDYYWVADDRGYADYVIGAFIFFGPHILSLYHFWFVILIFSATLFIISFGKKVWATSFLALLMLGYFFALEFLKLLDQVPIFDSRFFEVLALIPIYHMIFSAVFLTKTEFKRKLLPLLGQVFIFVFLYHARSSLGWEIIAVILSSLLTMFLRKSWNTFPPISVILILLSSLLLLTSYQHFVYNPNYFGKMGVRTFWHNALMGYFSRINDKDIAEIVLNYANNSQVCSLKSKALSAQSLLNTLGNWGTADWLAYEDCAKKAYFSLLLENSKKSTYLYLIHKPLNTLREQIYLFSGLDRRPVTSFSKSPMNFSQYSPQQTLRFSPLNIRYLTVVGLIFLFSIRSLYFYQSRLVGITFLIFISSMIPSVAFYSVIQTRGGLSVSMLVFFYLLLGIGLYDLLLIFKRFFYNCREKLFIAR